MAEADEQPLQIVLAGLFDLAPLDLPAGCHDIGVLVHQHLRDDAALLP